MENKKKLIDLGILSEDEASGVKRVSIVEKPAIELDFRYFGKQYGFVKPRGGESQDEFISRCIPVLRNEGKPEDQAIAICYSYWEEGFDVVVEGAPYVAPYIKKKNGKAEEPITKAILMESWYKDAYIVETIIALAKELGTKEEDLAKLFEMEFANAGMGGGGTNPSAASQQKDRELILYKYTGDTGANSRDFCIQMTGLNLFYTREQVQAMSDIAVNAGFGIDGASTYSIWSFKGGPNCKHQWNDFLVKSTKDGKISYQDLGPAAGRAGTTPYNMPKHGYYNKAAFKFASEDQMILVGPAMIPNVSISRIDADGEKYFVRFSPETIKEICMKYMKEARTNDVNTDHEENSAGAYIYESWIVESEDDKANTVYGYNVPIGTWMVAMKVDNKATWARIKSGELRGFSIEGILMDLEELEAKKAYERIKNILK